MALVESAIWSLDDIFNARILLYSGFTRVREIGCHDFPHIFKEKQGLSLHHRYLFPEIKIAVWFTRKVHVLERHNSGLSDRSVPS
jgi:hypothetical protein